MSRAVRWLAAALLCMAMPAGAKLDAGTTPPDYLGKTPDRDEIHISQFKGRVVVVTFWASWCGPCRRELPALDALKKTAGDRAEIIAVNVKDTAEDYRLIRRQLKGTALTFTHDRDGKISEAFKVTSYPNLYVIDQAGVIARVHVGFGEDSMNEIIDDINALLVAPKQAAAPATAAG